MIKDEVRLSTTEAKVFNIEDLRETDKAGGSASSGGVKEFTSLTDTPNSYLGEAGKIAKISNSENGLEFTDDYVTNTTTQTISGAKTFQKEINLETVPYNNTSITALVADETLGVDLILNGDYEKTKLFFFL